MGFGVCLVSFVQNVGSSLSFTGAQSVSFEGLLTVDPRRRLTLAGMLSHDWICGRIDVPTTPLMTPDVLDMSGSHVGAALRVAMHAYHKAARTGFTLMDVSNAPLAKRRKKKNCSTESQKESSDSTETNDSRSEASSSQGKESSAVQSVSLNSEAETEYSWKSNGQNKVPPPLAVCLSPSISSQKTVESIASNREPPPLRPISSDCERVLSGRSSNSTEANFFFKDFTDARLTQVSPLSLVQLRNNNKDLSDHSSTVYEPIFPRQMAASDLKTSVMWTSTYSTSPSSELVRIETVKMQNRTEREAHHSGITVQSKLGHDQISCSSLDPLRIGSVSKASVMGSTTECDVLNNNVVNVVIGDLRGNSGQNPRKRPRDPSL